MQLADDQKRFMAVLVAEKLTRMRAQLREVEVLYETLTGEGAAVPPPHHHAGTAKPKPATAKKLKVSSCEKSKYKYVYPKPNGKWWVVVGKKSLGFFDTEAEAAAVAAKYKGVPVAELLKGEASGKTEKVPAGKPAAGKLSKLDMIEAGVDKRDLEWLNDE